MPSSYDDLKAKLELAADDAGVLDADALMRRAIDDTGLTDFGDPSFRPGLEALCRSGREVGLNAVGVADLSSSILNHLIQRLRFQDLWKRHPEILDEPIEQPIIIVGLTRSGTSFLYHLLSQNPALRYPRFWEVMNPLPEHDPAVRPPDDDPLIEKARQGVDWIHEFVPRLPEMHQMEIEGPEEEIYLFGATFTAMTYPWYYRVPGFSDWLQSIDHEDAYRYLRRILQTLQWMRGGRRWLLKAVQHVGMLKPLMAAFPDAVVVKAFRDPVTATVSISNLCAYGERVRFDHPDPLLMGRTQVELTRWQLDAFMRDHHLLGRSVNVYFRDLMRDPVAQARRVHEAAGLAFTPEVERRMVAFVDENQREKLVKNEYAAEDFGIDAAALRAALRDYYDRFAVPVEDGR